MNPSASAPNVCVIIAAYNAAATIERAIRSALTNPEAKQIIVVDDVSKDETVRIARGLDDGSGRLTVLQQTVNQGPAAARNRALEIMDAEWFTVLDADDFFEPTRLRELLKYSDSADLIADNMWKVDEHNVDGPRRSMLNPAPTAPMHIGFETFVRSNNSLQSRLRTELGFIKPLIRTSLLKQYNVRYAADLRLGEDYELYTRLLAHGARLLLIPHQGYVSVVRANSISCNHSEGDLIRLRDADDRLLRDLTLTAEQRRAIRAHYLDSDCRYQWRMLILAVKQRNLAAAARCFMRPLPVVWYLTRQLAEQFKVRVLGGK